jgi:hypothetical protein
MLARFFNRYLDPDESLGELLFGLIMALTFTLGARLLSEDIATRELVVGMIGCNIAWGVIDAVLYLIGSRFVRNQRVHFVRRLRAAKSEAEALDAVRQQFGLEDEPPLRDDDRMAFHRVVHGMLTRAGTEDARLRAADLQAAAAIIFLVALTAVPGVLPFLVLEDSLLALRTANAIQIVLLFLVGYRWALYSGANPWRVGFGIVVLGVALVAVAVALGG